MRGKTDALMKRLQLLQAKHAPESHLWVFVLEEGEELTPEQLALIGPRDRVRIEPIPRGYFGDIPKPEEIIDPVWPRRR